MCISLETYRQRIGCFTLAAPIRHKTNLQRNESSSPSSFLLLSILIISTASPNYSCPRYKTSFMSSLSSSSQCSALSLQPRTGICWPFSNEGNTLVHALNGNKRNIGYKYLSWNCGRGLISENKMDDLKLFISRHQPHVIGISEVDLKRNVNDHEGTGKLLEDLSINDYNIFLPKSWDSLGTARLLVYARDDLKSA